MESYDEIYARMKNSYEEKCGAKISDSSDIAIRLRVLAGEVFSLQSGCDWLKRQMFLNTAVGESLDLLASQRGITRKQAQKAVGEITFFIDSAVDYDITVPAGSVVSTADEVPIRFVTTETDTIPSGGELISVSAEAELAGRNGNIAKYKATTIVSAPSEITSVRNPIVFELGSDLESDDELRERIRASYVNHANGSNKAFYEELALSVEGVAKAGAVARVRGVGTIDVYVSGKGEAVDSSTLANVQAVLDSESELAVDVKAINAGFVDYDMTVSVTAKSGYDDDEVVSLCRQAFEDYINSIEIGGKLYLSALGRSLMNTDCIENYEFDVFMADKTVAVTQCLRAGNVSIGVV